MNKYKIGKYIVKADSICDAVSIVRQIKNTSSDSIKDGKYVSELKPGDVITKKDGSKWDVVLVRHTPFGIQVRMNSKTSPVKTEEITYRPTDMLVYDSVKDARTISPWALSPGKRILSEDGDKATVVSVKGDRRNGYDVVVKFDDGSTDKWYYMPDDIITVIDSGKKIGTMTDTVEKTGDSFQKDSRRINYDDDIIEVTLNGKVVFKGYAEDWLDNNFDSNFKWTGSQYEASNAKGKWVVRVIDSFQKDSLTVRDVIQSLINEETSAISSYNVALETLKDYIPDEAYEAIKAIRDDEQRHVENLYAVLNGNVTPKNLEN
nr:MAG TPA: Ubiquinone biosynthesis protein COQ7 [Caudoviricetes sp.]